jgi:hypothetical protein
MPMPASTRAELIDPDNPSRALAAQAQRLLASNLAPREARALAVLAADLGQQSAGANTVSTSPSTTVVAGDASLPTETPAGQNTSPTSTPDLAQAIQTATLPLPSATATITLTPVPTFTPRPTATPPSVQDAFFKLLKREDSCPPDGRPGLLKLQVNDAKGQPLAGVRITVTWEGGEDNFYTGLFPEVNPGYADFEMQPGIVYAVMVGETNEKIQEIRSANTCGLMLEFSQ